MIVKVDWNKIKKVRKELLLTQKQLWYYAWISDVQLRNIEKENKNTTSKTLELIVNKFNKTLIDNLNAVDKENRFKFKLLKPYTINYFLK